MSRIAVLSDVHGNLVPAEAARDEILGWSPDHVWFLGDAVAFGPEPSACMTLLRDGLRVEAFIQGNTDRYVTEGSWRATLEDPASAPASRTIAEGLRYAAESLNADERAELAAYRRGELREVNGVRFLLCHGAPGDDEFRLAADVERARIEERVAGCDADYVLCGHTHVPWRCRMASLEILNAGSVTYPFDGDPRGSWLALEVRDGGLVSAGWRRFEYDREETIRRLESTEMGGVETLVRRLRTARI